MILAAATALMLPSATSPTVFQCKVKTFQDTELSITLDDAEIIDRRGGNWVNKESGRVKIVTDNDPFLTGNADLLEFDRASPEPQRAVVRVVRDGPPPSLLVVIDLQISKKPSSDSFDMALVSWGLHGERTDRGTGTCLLKADPLQ